MVSIAVFVLIPVIGCVLLWILGSIFFLVYFRVFKVQKNLGYVDMIKSVPAYLAILTVPICSILSFYVTTRIMLEIFNAAISYWTGLEVGVAALMFTVVVDLIVTPLIEKVSIRAFPLNFMYLFAWIVIIPSVLVATLQ